MKKLALVGFVTLSAVIAGVSPAYASTFQSSYVGAQAYEGLPITKVDTLIARNTDAYVGTTSGTFSCVWDMIASSNNTSTNQWFAQTGWMKSYSSTVNDGIYYFFEEHEGSLSSGRDIQFLTNGSTNDTAGPFTGAVGPATNYQHSYDVYYQSGDWYGSVDGAFTNTFWATDASNWNSSAHYVQLAEEASGIGYSRFFGSSSNPTNFVDPVVYNSTYGANYPTYTLFTDTYDSPVEGGESSSGNGTQYFTLNTWDVRGNN